MAADFSVEAELRKLWSRGMNDDAVREGGYEPALVRLDMLAHRMLMREARELTTDLRSNGEEPTTWRGMPMIVEAILRPAGCIEGIGESAPIAMAPALMTIEFRQRGKHGRSIYFDWSAEEYARETAPKVREREHMAPEEIRRIRKAAGLTQAQAGAVLGGGPRAFQKYESGTIRPADAMIRLLRLLDTDADAVLRILAPEEVDA